MIFESYNSKKNFQDISLRHDFRVLTSNKQQGKKLEI
jgi:hypothetical protein